MPTSPLRDLSSLGISHLRAIDVRTSIAPFVLHPRWQELYEPTDSPEYRAWEELQQILPKPPPPSIRLTGYVFTICQDTAWLSLNYMDDSVRRFVHVPVDAQGLSEGQKVTCEGHFLSGDKMSFHDIQYKPLPVPHVTEEGLKWLENIARQFED